MSGCLCAGRQHNLFFHPMTLLKGFLTLLLVIATGHASAADDPKPKDKRAASHSYTCWFLNECDGTDSQTLRIQYEYSRDFWHQHLPQGTGKGFHWSALPKGVKVEARPLLQRNKRNYFEICYQSPPAQGSHREQWDVMLVYETDEGWFRPVFVGYADEDRYTSEIVSTDKHPLALTVTMTWSGNGQMASHFLFDLWSTPRLATSAGSGRLHLGDYGSDAEYEKAIKHMQRDVSRAKGD